MYLYHSTTLEQKYLGLSWYSTARSHAQYLANKHGISLAKAAGVISALSPNNKWERNLLDADLFIQFPSLATKVCTYTANRIKALKILAVDNDSLIIEILGGTKTKSFYHNILNEESDMVTVDLWMYRAAELSMSNKNYKIISNAIIELAMYQGLKPYQVQAILWGGIRDQSINKVSVAVTNNITASIAS